MRMGKCKRRTPRAMALAAAVGVVPFLACATARGASGTWTQTVSGALWSFTTNWSGGTVADGTGFTADFGTLNITADTTVQLNTARTIGNLTFGDITPSHNWTLDNNSVSGNVLTLAVSSGTPTTVSTIRWPPSARRWRGRRGFSSTTRARWSSAIP